jgi:epoxyqueuosine reductase QueG
MQEKLIHLIESIVHNYAEINHCQSDWGPPLIGFAQAEDPLFAQLRQVVSPTHALPRDLLAEARTVLVYYLPFLPDIARSNKQGKLASLQWSLAYVESNRLILDINRIVKQELNKYGYNSTLLPATHNFDAKQLISDWSHRHVAYIAGLGTFGINNMLITDQGCTGRLGSIIMDIELVPTPRPDYEYCLYKYDGSCQLCIERCPHQALSLDHFDRHRCYDILLYNDSFYPDDMTADACGKCCVALPCSFINPVAKLHNNKPPSKPVLQKEL